MIPEPKNGKIPGGHYCILGLDPSYTSQLQKCRKYRPTVFPWCRKTPDLEGEKHITFKWHRKHDCVVLLFHMGSMCESTIIWSMQASFVDGVFPTTRNPKLTLEGCGILVGERPGRLQSSLEFGGGGGGWQRLNKAEFSWGQTWHWVGWGSFKIHMIIGLWFNYATLCCFWFVNLGDGA